MRITTIYIKCVFSTLLAAATVLGALISPFFTDTRILYQYLGRYVVLKPTFLLTPIRIHYHGYIPPGPVVIAANHRSLLDTLAMLSIIDRPLFAVTEPLDAMPSQILRDWVYNLGYIPVIRDKKDEELHRLGIDRHHVVPLCVQRVKQGESLLIYPEAHHERRRGMLRFKTGAVRTALGAQVPVVPVAITGTDRVVSPEYYRVRPGDVHIRVGAPMDLRRYYGQQENRKLVRELTGDLKRRIQSLIP